MTPKQKAEQLTDSFLTASFGVMKEYIPVPYPFAKQCALIAVEETIRTLNEDIRDVDVRGNILLDLIDYWREVKQEIEKL